MVGIQSVAHNAEDGVKKLWYSQDTIYGLLCSIWNSKTLRMWCAYIRHNYFCNVLDAHINML